jgi:hypothetical protein
MCIENRKAPRRLGRVCWPLDVYGHRASSAGGAFMSLDPAAREGRISAQITTCVVASPHRHHGGRWLNSSTLYEAANWRWCGCGRPFALIWGITLSLDLCRELKHSLTLWVTALAAINASNVGGGRPRLNIHKFFLRIWCILIIGRIAGLAYL